MIKRHPKSSAGATTRRIDDSSENRRHEKRPQSPMERAARNANRPATLNDGFRKFAHKTSALAGTPWAFLIALLIIVVWAFLGPIFGFSDTWQLVVNTATTIVTFLMVFLIQNTQNRDAHAIHLKLDELIYAVKGAHNNLINLENLSDEELAKLQNHFDRIGKGLENRRSNPMKGHGNNGSR